MTHVFVSQSMMRRIKMFRDHTIVAFKEQSKTHFDVDVCDKPLPASNEHRRRSTHSLYLLARVTTHRRCLLIKRGTNILFLFRPFESLNANQ